MHAVILLICPNNVFMALIQRYEIVQCIFMYISVYTRIYFDIHRCYVQDTVVVVPPYPYCIEEDRLDVDLEDCWYARPQLFFKCHLRPKNAREPKNSTYKVGPGIYMHIHVYVCLSLYKPF